MRHGLFFILALEVAALGLIRLSMASSLDQCLAPCWQNQNCIGERAPKEASSKKLNLLEPAAGLAPDPYTRPDLEQLERQKLEWWKNWAPTNDPGNPYRKW